MSIPKIQHRTAQEHYLEAERLLYQADIVEPHGDTWEKKLMKAQIHATLAAVHGNGVETQEYLSKETLKELGQYPALWESE